MAPLSPHLPAPRVPTEPGVEARAGALRGPLRTARRCEARGGSTSHRAAAALQDQFHAMRRGFRDSGGLAGLPELLALFQRNAGPDAAVLARWIRSREVLCIEWSQQTWFPAFQFDRRRLAPRADIASLYAELIPTFDAWDLACWFTFPNPFIGERMPVELFHSDLAAVREAARTEHFLLNG